MSGTVKTMTQEMLDFAGMTGDGKMTAQGLLDFEGITEDGIIVKGQYYSRLYHLTDSNFATENEEKQEDILKDYAKLVNRFPDNAEISIAVVNKRSTKENLAQSFHLRSTGDGTDKYVEAYNGIIDAKIKEGNNDIRKEKYILLTLKEKSLSDARSTFNTADISLNEGVKAINKTGVRAVGAVERLSIMNSIMCGAGSEPFITRYGRYMEETAYDEDESAGIVLNAKEMKRRGVSVKDLVCEQGIVRGNWHLQLGYKRFCRSFTYTDLPGSLDTSFLTRTTDLPYEMVTVIQLGAVPRKKAVTSVKMMNTSVKADVIKASKRAFQGGYDPSLIDEDLQTAQAEAKKLRNDVVVQQKKLFFATICVTLIGESEEELASIAEQYRSRCSDYSITPNFLVGQQAAALNMSLLTGHGRVINDRMMTSDGVCALLPFNIQELMEQGGHFYGINSVSKNMIMYSRKRSKLPHGLVFGSSGNGKSFLVKGAEIIPNYLDGGNDDMIILDPENEYGAVTEALGGTVLDIEPNAEYHINPCDLSMEWDNPKAAPLMEKCDYMVGLVESILGRGRECNSYEVNAIHRATSRMYDGYIKAMTERHKAAAGAEGGIADIDCDPSICPTLEDFYRQLREDGSVEGNKIASAVEAYCVGEYNLFAHRTDIGDTGRLVTFNLLYVPEKMKEMAMKVCTSYIWNRIVKNRENNAKNHTRRFIWVFLDEIHLFFETQSSAGIIKTMYKRARKYGGIITGITQDVADVLRNPQGSSVYESTGFFIFLSQSPLGRSALQNLYQISDTLIDYINDKAPGTGLLYNASTLIPFDFRIPQDNELYRLISTNPNDGKDG